MLGTFAAARGNGDAQARGGQRRDEVAADESGPAHHQHVAVLHTTYFGSSSMVGGSTPPGGRIAPSRVFNGTGFWLSTAL